MNAVVFDAELLRRYDRPGPRYTSYPAAPQFTTAFGATQLRDSLARSNALHGTEPLSLYAHIPFCFSPCFYCGCNRVISRDVARGIPYAARLLREIEQLAPLIAPQREVAQLHLGGGTPNFLALETLERLIGGIGRALSLSRDPGRDFSIELDPRTTPRDYPAALARLGFNRVSLGVQDFDATVQRAVNRLQGVEQTLDLIDACRDSGLRSVNIDLIYGLPRQTVAGFRRTLRTVVAARPDRLAVYGYAHLPGLFKAQRHIEPAELPDAATRLALLQLAIEELSVAGYRYIGMDHFALPDDELVHAQESGRLQRNFMGYSTHAGYDLIGIGASAISHVGDTFSQNFRDLKSWEAAVDAGRPPVWRGLVLSGDDRVRGAVIAQLMCQGAIDTADIARRYGLDFGDYFRSALERLRALESDGLVLIQPGRISATPVGRLLLRNIAMCFDGRLEQPRAAGEAPAFSRAV
ncbi:MAG TPA: oxygen-independent coproporphyrinogen III oxidase [Steroidobacteraceae bacterium]|nr:oxygen-independent coproporphyrinogen III oxidase [Steroidobacteraceae bacterium]